MKRIQVICLIGKRCFEIRSERNRFCFVFVSTRLQNELQVRPTSSSTLSSLLLQHQQIIIVDISGIMIQ